MRDEEKAEIGSALFNAMNALGYASHFVPKTGGVDLKHAQDSICKAIDILGGVDKLIEIGA